MFNIIMKETKEFLSDRTNLFFLILFPIILIFLLGNLLSSLDKAEETIGEIKIHYKIETEDVFQQAAIQQFITELGKGNSMIVMEQTDNLEASKEQAGNDEIACVALFTGNPMEIQIYEGNNNIKNKAVNAIFSGFVQSNKAIQAVYTSNPQFLQELDSSQSTGEQADYVEQKDLGVNRTMIDYYAVSMLAMITFMSVLGGAGAFMGERQNKTINRLILTPKNRIHVFLGKMLGMIPQTITQITILMVVSVFVFKAHYAATLEGNILLFMLFVVVTLCMISIGAVIGIVIKVNPMAVLFPILWTMMFLGGTYSKELKIAGVTEAMPIYQIQQAAYDLTVFGHYQKAIFVILLAGVIMIAALVAGAFLFKNKQEER
ncbi:MAG: ABC transporter permease [Mobilitalea sp.]